MQIFRALSRRACVGHGCTGRHGARVLPQGFRGTLLTLVLHAGLQLYGQARCAGPCAVFSAEVGTHSVDVFIKPAPSFVDQVRRPTLLLCTGSDTPCFMIARLLLFLN